MGEAQQRVPLKRGARRSVWVEDAPLSREKRAIKCFHAPGALGRAFDRMRAERELATLARLGELGFPVPRPLGVRMGESSVELALAWIEDAVTLHDLLHGAAPWPVAPTRVACELGRLLALAATEGVVHHDAHSKNLLVDARGRVWLVDAGGIVIRGRAFARAALERNVVTLAAELREIAPLAWRLRVLNACARARGERVTRSELSRWNQRARERRRAVVRKAVLRWLRESSVTARIERDGRGGLRARELAEPAAWRALDDPSAAWVEREGRLVNDAWRSMAWCVEHALPCCAPWVWQERPAPRAVFATPVGLAPRAGAHARPAPRRLARAVGTLLGHLHDRGAALVTALEPSITFDAALAAHFTPQARFRRAGGGQGDSVERARAWASRANRLERAAFAAAFLRAVEEPRAAHDDLRRRLLEPLAAPKELLRRRVRAGALVGATRAAAWIPNEVVHGALVSLSPLAALSRHERITRANLELALGGELDPARLDAIARGVRRHAARQLAEWLRLASSSPPDGPDPDRGRWIEDQVELDPSVAVLDRELARAPGAIIVSAHIGNWELLAARLRRRGHAGAVVGYRRPKDGTARWLARLRERYGVANIAQSDSPRAILRALDEGRVVGLLADLEVRRLAGVFVPFFGRSALTMTAPAALARATRRRLVPARCVFDRSRGRYRLSFEEPLELDRALPRREAVTRLVTQLNEVFERWIRADPEQWAWHQPRWRTQPGEVEIRPWPARVARQGSGRRTSLHGVDPGLSPD